jgi:hypothetical protein
MDVSPLSVLVLISRLSPSFIFEYPEMFLKVESIRFPVSAVKVPIDSSAAIVDKKPSVTILTVQGPSWLVFEGCPECTINISSILLLSDKGVHVALVFETFDLLITIEVGARLSLSLAKFLDWKFFYDYIRLGSLNIFVRLGSLNHFVRLGSLNNFVRLGSLWFCFRFD